jgi:hypothetical protein
MRSLSMLRLAARAPCRSGPVTSTLGIRMRILPLATTLFLTSLSCQAGYSEYHFLALSACESFLISSDTVAPDASSPQASAEYKAYIAAKHPDRASFFSLYIASRSTERWADCRETDKEIACTVIGQFRYQSFTCPLGQSKQWSRSCTSNSGKFGELKIYSVDTAEYELGGNPVVNQYLQTDRTRFTAQCKKKPILP